MYIRGNSAPAGTRGLGRFWLLSLAVVMPSLAAGASTWIEIEKLFANQRGLAGFGSSVAMDGDTAIVGAPRDPGDGEEDDSRGAAYVFTRDDSGEWHEQAKLVPRISGLNHFFGFSVDIDGDTAIVGMSEDDLNPVPDAAYIFTRDNSENWSEQAVLRASDAIFGDAFGFSVAVDGNTAMVGTSPETSTGLVDLTGAVYVFTKDAAGNWTEQAKLVASDAEIGDTFGKDVDLDGDIAVIGRERNEEDGSGTVRVSAYIFTRDASGAWTEEAKLEASERTNFRGEFAPARPVAIDNKRVILGAGQGQNRRGFAYIFKRNASGIWIEEAELTNRDDASSDDFGSAAALINRIAVVGAPHDDENGSSSGSAYIFMRDSSAQWDEQTKLLASDGGNNDRFGSAVAAIKDAVLIGAPGDDDNGFGSGSAYLFQLMEAIEVEIDIKPREEPNSINPSSGQKIAVAVLTTETFDAVQVDPLSVEFGPSGAMEFHGRGHVQDVDGDRDADLVLHFDTRDTGIACGDRRATLSGETFSGEAITGSDSIRTVRCK